MPTAQDFFEENKYTLLKNYLYNYLLRKMAVEKKFTKRKHKTDWLRVGLRRKSQKQSDWARIVYQKLSEIPILVISIICSLRAMTWIILQGITTWILRWSGHSKERYKEFIERFFIPAHGKTLGVIMFSGWNKLFDILEMIV